MKTIKNYLALMLVLGLMFVSCKKDLSTTGSSTLGVKIQATNKTFSLLKSASLSTPTFVWDTCTMNVSKVEFEAEKRESTASHDSSEVHLEWTGPKRIDLFSINSVIGDISLQPGVYDEISLKILALKIDAGNAPVFYLSGSYINQAGTTIPVIVSINEDFEFKVKKEGTSLDATNDYTSLINMNLSLLMAGIQSSDLESASLSNGKIIISSASNLALFNKINTNLPSCEVPEFSRGREGESGKGSDSGNGSGSGSGSGSGQDDGSGKYY